MARFGMNPCTRPSLRLVGVAVVVFLFGCEDVDWDWERQEWVRSERPIRPIRPRAPRHYDPRQPRVRTTPPPSRQPADEQVARREPWEATPESPRPAKPATPPSVDSRSYYNLYLISEQASLKALPNSKKLRLEHAKSRPAAEVLDLVYPSIGPSGSEGQRFLVYQHEPMWAAAAEFAPLLDCVEQDKTPATAPARPMKAFQVAVGMYYHLRRPGQPTDFDGYKTCVALLTTIARNAQASGQLRYGAAILSGRIAVETLSEFAQARAAFEQARQLALPGSVEEMVADYFLADTYMHEGQQSQAVNMARELVKRFTAHRFSRVYERAMDLAGPK